MPKKRYNAEDIIDKLRETDVLLSEGMNVSQICKRIGIADQTYYRWRKVHGGMKVNRAKRLKELETENARLKRAVADLAVDKLILKEVATITGHKDPRMLMRYTHLRAEDLARKSGWLPRRLANHKTRHTLWCCSALTEHTLQ